MTIIQLQASQDPDTGQTYIPPRALAADGSLRPTVSASVPAQGVLYSATTFNGDQYGIIDLDCGSRIQALLEPGTDRIGERAVARSVNEQGQPRFSHE